MAIQGLLRAVKGSDTPGVRSHAKCMKQPTNEPPKRQGKVSEWLPQRAVSVGERSAKFLSISPCFTVSITDSRSSTLLVFGPS